MKDTKERAGVPDAAGMTASPLRHRLSLELDADVAEVWTLVGDLTRYPEYSVGLARVDAEVDARGANAGYTCHFKPMAPGEPEIAHRETITWWAPGVGYASRAEADNAFGLRDSLTLVTIEPSRTGTILTWTQHYEADDLEMLAQEFGDALTDIGKNLVGMFGGRIIENR